MSFTRTTTIDVREDHTAVIELPSEIPTGAVTITYTVATPGEMTGGKMTGAELVREFGNLWADRDDLPNSPEEFAAWRKHISERGSS